jgi:hypothetical protein
MKKNELYYPPKAETLLLRPEDILCTSDVVDTEEWGTVDYSI